MWRALIHAAFLLVTTGCAGPISQEVGPAVTQPELRTDVFVTADGAELVMQSWQAEAPQAVIIGLHGMNDYAKTFAMPGPWWADRQVTTYAFDQRGFGRSPGKGIWPGSDTLRADTIAFVKLIKQRHPDLPLYILGVSMGGAVALTTFVHEDAPKVDGLILVAPAVWGWSTLNPLYKATLWLSAHVVPSWKPSGARLNITPSDNVEMLRDNYYDDNVIKGTRTDAIYGLVGLMDEGYFAVEHIGAPSLVLYGERDEIIPRKPFDSAVNRLNGDKHVVTYAKGYHMLLRDLQREVVWRDILAWIQDKDGPMPSEQGIDQAHNTFTDH